MEVLVALSGGVDSSVAAALLIEQGHDVTAVTMKLWGGPSDTGCCSVSDVDDARRVAQQLGIDHFTFNFGEDFEEKVVAPYVAAHAAGVTPNPCVACNRHLKFDRLLERARRLGFDAVATGHHARVERASSAGGAVRLRRGVDRAKDQSYVLHMLGRDQLASLLLPVGEMTKAEVRARAAALGLRTSAKPDSQDVCFITDAGGRAAFLGARIPLRPGRVVDTAGNDVGSVDAVELVTVGQRRGLGGGGGTRRFALDVDVASATVVVGEERDLHTAEVTLDGLTWVDGRAAEGPVLAQCSAHGAARAGTLDGHVLRWHDPQRRVARGQSVALYAPDDDVLLGGATAR